MTSGARRSCPSRSRHACHPAQRVGSKTRCPGTTAAQGAATPAAGGDCSGCGGKRRREPGPAYSQEKPLLSTQRPARSCSPEAVSGMSRPHHRKTLGASVPQSCIQGLGRLGWLPPSPEEFSAHPLSCWWGQADHPRLRTLPLCPSNLNTHRHSVWRNVQMIPGVRISPLSAGILTEPAQKPS